MSDTRFSEADIAAREAEIIGKPQRLEPLSPDEFDDEAMALVMSVRGSLGVHEMDEIPPVFGVMLRHPGAFRCQMEMGVQLLGKGVLSRRERELAILRVGWLCQAPYEFGEHVDIAKRYDIDTEEIERVVIGSSAQGWSDHERAILKGVEELLSDHMISDDTWNTLAQSWDDKQLMEFPILVGQYFTVALQQNSLRIRLAEDNPGLRNR
jgi:alkylhydroperoxidase family enzyme